MTSVGGPGSDLTGAEGPAWTRVGMIVPFDFVLDAECWQYVPAGVSLHVTRLPHISLPYGLAHARELTREDLLEQAVGSLMAIRPATIAFSCTSASFVDGLAGERRIVECLVRAGAQTALTTSGALLDAVAELRVRRLAIASPYPPEIAARLRAFVEEAGIEVAAQVDLNILNFEQVARATPGAVAEMAQAVARDGADAVFLPGTNLPTIEMIAATEHALGMPVLAANQVTMWGVLRRAGAPQPRNGQRLFELDAIHDDG